VYVSGYILLAHRSFAVTGHDGTQPLYVRLFYRGSLVWFATVKRLLRSACAC
jgi:hypothetical protein